MVSSAAIANGIRFHVIETPAKGGKAHLYGWARHCFGQSYSGPKFRIACSDLILHIRLSPHSSTFRFVSGFFFCRRPREVFTDVVALLYSEWSFVDIVMDIEDGANAYHWKGSERVNWVWKNDWKGHSVTAFDKSAAPALCSWAG